MIMEKWIGASHAAATVVLVLGYIYLLLMFRRKEDSSPVTLGENIVAYLVRFVLLLLYVSGLILTTSIGRPVHRVHHYVSLLPVAVLLLFQLLPAFKREKRSFRQYSWLFLALAISVIITALTSRFGTLPRF